MGAPNCDPIEKQRQLAWCGSPKLEKRQADLAYVLELESLDWLMYYILYQREDSHFQYIAPFKTHSVI